MTISRQSLGDMIQARMMEACKSFDELVHKPRWEAENASLAQLKSGHGNLDKRVLRLEKLVERLLGAYWLAGILVAGLVIVIQHYWK